MSERLKYFLRNSLAPAGLHLGIALMLSRLDPCNNNPGCMAGSLSGYFLVLFTIPTLVLLTVFAVVQAFVSEPNFNRHLKINSILAIVPFVIAGLLYLALKLSR